MAKDILLADSIDHVEAVMNKNAQDTGSLRIEPIEPGEACARIHAAMELTDMTLDARVGEDYGRLRALALLRADELPGPMPDVSIPELTGQERDRLLADFLASPEGSEVPPGSDEAAVASLAIDFCADYVDGRPLRWSPVTVELFMTGWLPGKLLAERSMFEAVPAALEAWIRYAGRQRGIPKRAIEQTAEAVAGWTDEMLELVDSGDAGGLTMEFVTAAKAAGIDLRDRDALATFIAGWNARSDAS